MTYAARADVKLPPGFRSMTMGAALRAAVRRNPHKIAVIDGERRLTYAQLSERTDRLRDAAITTLSLKHGDNVAIVARNCLEYIEIACGLPDAGAAVATVNPRLSPGEIKAVLEDSQAKVVFVDPASAEVVARAGLDPDLRIVTFGESYEALIANATPPDSYPVIEEWDVWTIPYTSGTTGIPKGVLLSHRSRMLLGLVSAVEFGCFGPDDKFLAMSPMSFGGGLAFPAATLSTGGTVEILDKFNPLETLERLKFGGFTGVFMVPTHFQMVFELPENVLERFRGPPVKTIICNAAPLPQAMKSRIIPYFGDTVLHEVYASTEAGLVSSLRPEHQLTKQSCVGTPLAHTHVSLRNEAGEECGPNEVGELFTWSPMLFNGYWNRPKETAAAFKDGWVSVGDLASRDEDGCLYIVGRKKDMVISGGVNIYPREIEEVLFKHPAILDVAVVGVPDERWGERLRTFAVVRPGATFTAQDMEAFCVDKLAAYKVPREVVEIEALPRNASGKVLKTELRELS